MEPGHRLSVLKQNHYAYEEVAVFPLFEGGGIYLADPRLKGYYRNIIGADPNLTYARIEEGE